jgi:hypothetical protein
MKEGRGGGERERRKRKGRRRREGRKLLSDPILADHNLRN